MTGHPEETPDEQVGGEPDVEESSSDRLYTLSQMRVGAFVGSWLAGYWMLMANYRVVGAPKRARKILRWALLTTVVFLVLVPCLGSVLIAVLNQVISGIESFGQPPSIVVRFLGFVPLVGLWFSLAALAINHAQKFDRKFNRPGTPDSAPEHSNLRVAVVSVIALTVLIVLLVSNSLGCHCLGLGAGASSWLAFGAPA